MKPPNPAAQEWLEQARHDLDTAERELLHKGWPEIICFHCQQAVEKLLKGVLVAYGEDITRHRIHDLPQLLKACLSHDKRLHPLTTACKQLTGFYIAARYPIGAHYTLADARRAVKAARKADFLVNKLFQG